MLAGVRSNSFFFRALHRQALINPSSVSHQPIISPSSAPHQPLISSSSAHHRPLHRQALTLSRRGCHAAALAVSTLTLSLDRLADPTRMKYLIDILALRASQPDTLWLIHQASSSWL